MNKQSAIAMLNRLLAIHYRSLPMYLADADPWTHQGDESATAAFADIVSSQKATTVRLADEIQRRGGVVDPGEFPIDYTDLHFLSVDFLLRELIAGFDRDIQDIEECARRLEADPTAKALAEEALGQARGHRQTLKELRPAAAGRT